MYHSLDQIDEVRPCPREKDKKVVKRMKISIWASVSICFVLIFLALIALATPVGILLVTGISGVIICIAIFFIETGRERAGLK